MNSQPKQYYVLVADKRMGHRHSTVESAEKYCISINALLKIQEFVIMQEQSPIPIKVIRIGEKHGRNTCEDD